MGLSLS
jgi:hypothetical protein